MSTLDALTRAIAKRDRAEAVVRDLARQAVDEGVPIAHIADAAGVARSTVYAWLRS